MNTLFLLKYLEQNFLQCSVFEHCRYYVQSCQEVENRFPRPNIKVPSFSLGLTQEEPLEVAAGNTVNGVDNSEDPQQSRKSKRQKVCPPSPG